MKQQLVAAMRRLQLIALGIEGLVVSNYNGLFRSEFSCTATTKRCCESRMSSSYRYHNIGGDIPPCCATHLVRITSDVASVLESNDLEYFMSFGTLLGAERHGGLIPWDTDLDFVISEHDQSRIFDVLRNELGSKYHIAIEPAVGIVGGEVLRVYLSKTNRLHLDLFAYTQDGDHIVFYMDKRLLSAGVFPLEKTKFYDLELYAPNDPDLHLRTLYGSDYATHAYRQWAVSTKKFEIQDFAAAALNTD